MKTSHILIFALLALSCFAIKTGQKSQQKALDVVKSKQFNTHLGRSVKSMIEMAEFEELGEVKQILTDVKGELEALLGKLGDDFDAITTSHTERMIELGELLETQKNRLDDLEAELSEVGENRDSAQTALNAALASISSAQSGITEETARRKNYAQTTT
mmetsp:Transcript_7140/g.6412  ORF Transcript_7140/g.6412 Transcript_7140/m.6412 type:complete len:159 (+) Transcript_7140:48-524(+)